MEGMKAHVRREHYAKLARADTMASRNVESNTAEFKFYLPRNVTRRQLKGFYKRRLTRFKKIMSTAIHRVPVTPPVDAKFTFHIVLLCDPLRPNLPKVELLIQEYDAYVVAFRIKKKNDPEDASNAPWFVFSDMRKLPDHITHGCIWLPYTAGYRKLGKVIITDYVLVDIYNFLIKFEDPEFAQEPATVPGEIYFQTLFVFLGEGLRFAVACGLMLENVSDPVGLRVTADMATLFTNWASLCKCLYELRLDRIEFDRRVAHYVNVRRQGVVPYTVPARLEERLGRLEKSFGGLIKFRGDGGAFSEEVLATQLRLLKLDKYFSTVIKIMMRLDNYKGAFIEKNNN